MKNRCLSGIHVPVVVFLLCLSPIGSPFAQETEPEGSAGQTAQDQCDDWVIEILEDAQPRIDENTSYDASIREGCVSLTHDLWHRQFLTVIMPEMVIERELAFSVYQQCMEQHLEEAKACMVVGSVQPCPPSDECDEVTRRYYCIFNQSKAYENEWNELVKRKVARELVDGLSDEKCIGDEAKMWDTIHEWWETLESWGQSKVPE